MNIDELEDLFSEKKKEELPPATQPLQVSPPPVTPVIPPMHERMNSPGPRTFQNAQPFRPSSVRVIEPRIPVQSNILEEGVRCDAFRIQDMTEEAKNALLNCVIKYINADARGSTYREEQITELKNKIIAFLDVYMYRWLRYIEAPVIDIKHKDMLNYFTFNIKINRQSIGTIGVAFNNIGRIF